MSVGNFVSWSLLRHALNSASLLLKQPWLLPLLLLDLPSSLTVTADNSSARLLPKNRSSSLSSLLITTKILMSSQSPTGIHLKQSQPNSVSPILPFPPPKIAPYSPHKYIYLRNLLPYLFPCLQGRKNEWWWRTHVAQSKTYPAEQSRKYPAEQSRKYAAEQRRTAPAEQQCRALQLPHPPIIHLHLPFLQNTKSRIILIIVNNTKEKPNDRALIVCLREDPF